jgi:hypothetical protein
MRYDFVIDSYSNYFRKPHNFSTVRAYYLYKGLKELGYSCFLRTRTGMVEHALGMTRFTGRFRRHLRKPSLPSARFLIFTYYQMPDYEWETVKAEYEQADIANFFNLQGFSIGDENDFYVNQTRWFREHGGNLCHTVTETRRSEREFLIGTGVDPKLFKPMKEKIILVECGLKENREKIRWMRPTISVEVINKALPRFQTRGFEVIVCGDNLDNLPFSFKPDRKFRYRTHAEFARLLSKACIYVAKDESYGLPLAEAQMAGTVLALMKTSYNERVILTKMFAEYNGARFENGRFVDIDESAESLAMAIETAIQITNNTDCHEQIRNSVLQEFDYRAQAKKVANACLAIAKSNDTTTVF